MNKKEGVAWTVPALDVWDRIGKVYKYRAFNEQSLSILIDGELFFASPESLNDPFDSQINFVESLNEALNWGLTKRPKYQANYVELLSLLGTSEALDFIESEMGVGICSFSSKPNHTLLWSHYGDEHKGFCIGIEQNFIGAGTMSTHFPDHVRSQPVTYTNGNPMVPVVSSFNNSYHSNANGPSPYTILSSAVSFSHHVKNLVWEYEQEIRMIHRRGPSAIPINGDSIADIIFGCRMPERHRNTLRNLASTARLDKVRFYEMIKSPSNLSFDVVLCDN